MSKRHLVRLEQEGSVLIVSPLFTFGNYSDAELGVEWASIEAKLCDDGVRHVTIDLSEVPYFGSTMLEWMVLIWKRIRSRGGRIVICNCSDLGRQILTAARFDTLWAIYPDRAGALETLTAGP